MKKIIGIITGLTASMYFAGTAFAQDALNLCPKDGIGGRGFGILCDLQPQNALGGILTFILIIAVIISLVYLIWGGIKWITSGGDKGNVETARNQIIAAIIGLIVAFLAWFLINLILSLFFQSSINELEIPSIDVTDDNFDARGRVDCDKLPSDPECNQ